MTTAAYTLRSRRPASSTASEPMPKASANSSRPPAAHSPAWRAGLSAAAAQSMGRSNRDGGAAGAGKPEKSLRMSASRWVPSRACGEDQVHRQAQRQAGLIDPHLSLPLRIPVFDRRIQRHSRRQLAPLA